MKKGSMNEVISLSKDLKILKVERAKENNQDIINIYIKPQKKKVRCPKCEEFSKKLHDYLKLSKILYLDNSGVKTYLIVRKRRFDCIKCKKAFTEEIEITTKNSKISLKTKQKVLKDFMDKNKTIKMIAQENHISEGEARNIFLEATKNYPTHIDYLPEIISIDEKATYTSEGTYSFIINDPIHEITLDIVKSRKQEYLIEYFLKVKNRKAVKVILMDLYLPYKEMVYKIFPTAIIVADPFHYTKYIEQGLNNVRLKLIKRYENNKNSYEYKMLKNRVNTGLLLKSFNETKSELKEIERKKELQKQGKKVKIPKDKFNNYWYGKIKIKRNNKFVELYRIDRLQQVLNINEELRIAYSLKEEFMRIKTHVNYQDAKKELTKWIHKCYQSNIEEMKSAASTIKNWLEEIVNSFQNDKYNNGFTESNNNKIDKIISIAYGYKNFEFFRKRALVILHQSYTGGSRKSIEKGQIKK